MASTKIMSKMVKKAITSPVGPLHRTSEGRATSALNSFSAPKKRSSLNMMEHSCCSIPHPQPATASLSSLLQQQDAEERNSSNKRFKRSGPSFEVTDLFSGLLGDHEVDFPAIEWDFRPKEEETKPKSASSGSNFDLSGRRSPGLVRSTAFMTASHARLSI